MRYLAALLVSAALVSAADFRNGQAAWAVVGQAGFTTEGVPPSQTVMATPSGLAWANGHLLVSDGNKIGSTSYDVNGNAIVGNRVLVFNSSSGNFLPDPHSDVGVTGNVYNTRCSLCGFPAQLVLGQPDFNSTSIGTTGGTISGSTMRNPTAVATDGTVVAVADTDNNRVLIWKNFPGSNGQPADVVLGQTDFSTVAPANSITSSTLRGPQGIWIQNGKLFVADTENNRVLIWNSIPTSNNQPADLVLGQDNFTSASAPNPQNGPVTGSANRLWSPTGVTADANHLYVTDTGFNRVLIWNGLPTTNDQPANVVVGQPDMTSAADNNAPGLCASTGTDSSGNATYSPRCEKSLSLPRYALSDGTRLFIADGGNDRVLIFNSIPTTNGAAADHVLGQPDMVSDTASDPSISFASTTIPNRAATDSIRTPTALAWDGTNLYVSDPYDLRVMVFTAGDNTTLAPNAILNAASLAIYQEGAVVLQTPGTITAGDKITITIGNASDSSSTTNAYNYTIQKNDTLATIASGLANQINSSNSGKGDPNVIAQADSAGDVLLTSRQSQLPNDSISLSASNNSSTNITATASGTYLTGGNAAVIAPGTIVVINGQNLTNGSSDQAPDNATILPTQLAGAQVYMDGYAAPLLYASPTQIKAQVPYSFGDANSASIFVRTTPASGPPQITNATGIIIATANPGIFTTTNTQLGPAMAVHSSNYASAVVSVDGSISAGDIGTITIAGKDYKYTVQSSDTLTTVRDALIAAINNGNDPNVTASAGGQFARVVLTAKQAGSAGNGISVATTVTAGSSSSSSSGSSLILTAYTSSTCCASTAGAPVTPSNPARPGETISLIATGLGQLLDVAQPNTGEAYNGTTPNTVASTVSATIGASTAQVINAGVPTGAIGLNQVDLIVPTGAATDPNAQVYIAQNAFVSNIATLPISGSNNSLVTFTASPNPIVTSGAFGQTTLTWNATGVQTVEIHINAPDGPLFLQGGPSGSATTGNWITDGSTFYLEDVSNGKTPSTVNTLASIVMRLGTPQSITSFTASEVDLPPGLSAGPSTLTWNAPASTAVEVHIGSATGALFTAGGPSGSATTGLWVFPGTTFYLVDVSNSGAPFTLATATPVVKENVAPTFFITNPVYATYNPNGELMGNATVTWDSPLTTNAEVHIGSPTGPLFTAGGPSGTATASGWVTNGTKFYLVDANTGVVLNTAIANVQLQPESGYLLLAQNPVQGDPNQTASVALSWSSNTATTVEVHVDSPNGPLFTGGGPQASSVPTGNWVKNGQVFYLQDVSNGQPLTSQFTIATQTVQFIGTSPNTSFQASPNPIPVTTGTEFGSTTLYWSAPSWVVTAEIHINSPDGPLFTHGSNIGAATASGWVADGTTFYLQDVTRQKPLTLLNTLGIFTVHLQQFPLGQ